MKYTARETPEMVGESRHPKFGVTMDELDAATYDWLWGVSTPERADVSAAAHIVDTADDIAYAVHDVEDGIWARMIPLDELVDENEFVRAAIWPGLERKRVHGSDARLFEHERHMHEAIDGLVKPIATEEWLRMSASRNVMPREARAGLKTWGASLIERYVDACVTDTGSFRRLPVELAREVEVLKQLAWVYMIDRNDMTAMKHGQRRIVRELFDAYWEDPEMLPDWHEHAGLDIKAEGENHRLLVDGARRRARIICDHIAGLTDRACLAEHGRMFGSEVPYVLLDGVRAGKYDETGRGGQLMTKRVIKRVGNAYVLYTEEDRRISAYLTAPSAERAAERSLLAHGGGTIVRVDGTTRVVEPVATTAAV